MGTTRNGGIYENVNPSSSGTIFEFNINTNVYTKKIDFNSSTTGGNPKGLVLGENGKLYGLCENGGASQSCNPGLNFGTIYEYNSTTNMLEVRQHLAQCLPSQSFLRYPQFLMRTSIVHFIIIDSSGFLFKWDAVSNEITFTSYIGNTANLIEIGSLSQYKYYACEKPMSVLGLKKRGGDFKSEEIEQQNPIEIVANQVSESYQRHLVGKQAVIFAVSVAHSIAITEHLRSTGIRAHHLDGMSPTSERRSAMELFRNREIQILSNCSLFDEGLDIPSIDGIILARPTASLSRYLQMVGRGLRPCAGKQNAVIIDLADNFERHGMPDDDRNWTLDGIPKKVKERKEGSARERNVITDEIETVNLFDTGTEYIEIAGKTVVLTPELREWMRLADRIIAEGIERSFKPGWSAHALLSSKNEPPIEAWKYLGKKLGYHHAWADYKFKEWAAK